MSVIERALTRPNVRQLAKDVMSWCAEVLPAMSEHTVESRVEAALFKLQRYRLDHEDAAERFLRLAVAFAPDFDEQAAVQALLNRLDLAAELRLELVAELLTLEEWCVVASRNTSMNPEPPDVSEVLFEIMRP
jgi:hypothetical protein